MHFSEIFHYYPSICNKFRRPGVIVHKRVRRITSNGIIISQTGVSELATRSLLLFGKETGFENSFLKDCSLVISGRQKSEVVEMETLVGSNGSRPCSGVQDEWSGQVTRWPSYSYKLGFSGRLHANQIGLFGIVRILR